ncbi:translation machinery-associated protein 16 [Periplaneta americana]|uniref:translation machinery-associated protein 16 n=1 Tax=Periplaneta americana TaxID=6978 RepID=UPI0037E80301
MPNSAKKELSKKIIHPRSRKALKLTKQIKKVSTREKVKLVHHVKQNMLGEKLLWFRDHLLPDVVKYTPELTLNIIQLYLGRFQEELEQISLKHAIGNRKNRQHANREDIIRLTLLREEEEFATCGLEIPDLMNAKQLEILRSWNGELRFLQNFKLKRFSRKNLQSLISSSEPNQTKLETDESTSTSAQSKVPESQPQVADEQEDDNKDSCEDAVTCEVKEDTSMDVDT